jgi:hypothetical protein
MWEPCRLPSSPTSNADGGEFRGCLEGGEDGTLGMGRFGGGAAGRPWAAEERRRWDSDEFVGVVAAEDGGEEG